MTRFNDNRRLHIFRRRRVDPARSTQLTDGNPLRALDRLVAERRRDRVHLEPRAERRSVLQLRPVHAAAVRQLDPPADVDGKRRVSAAVVARRQDDRLPGDQARSHRSRDHDGGHPRLVDRRRRIAPARAGQRHRQPSGRAGVDAGRQRAMLFTVQERGSRASVSVADAPAASRSSVVGDRGTVGEFSIAKTVLAYALTTPVRSRRSLRSPAGR